MSIHRGRFLYAIFFLAIGMCLFLLPPAVVAETNDRMAECAKIEDNTARLQCFDKLAGRKTSMPEAANTTPVKMPAAKEASAETENLSVMTRHWDLDTSRRKHSFVLRPYRLNYILPFTYNSSPNEDTDLEYDPKAKAQRSEAKFQISFKAKAWKDVLQKPLQGLYDKNPIVKGMDIWMAYTQLSYWQLYNSAFSAPFRDTNYEPELLFNFRSGYEIPGLMGTKLQYFNVGFNHQSNGRSKPLSRSWNRIVANIGLEKNNFGLELKTWYRLPEDENSDDNPDLTRYMGYGELWGTFYWQKQRIAVMLRNNLRQNNMGAVQVDWSVPFSWFHESLSDKFSLYVQYFNGYGEGLLDYNKSINRIGVGLMLAEWN